MESSNLLELTVKPENFAYLEGLLSTNAVKLHYEGHHLAYQKKLVDFFKNNSHLLNAIEENFIGLDYSYHPIYNHIHNNFLIQLIFYGLENNNVLLYNNGAQIWNHNFLWHSFTKHHGFNNLEDFLKENCPIVYENITKSFQGFNEFLQELISAHEKLMGNIWIWIVWNTIEEKIEIKVSGNAGSLSHYNFLKPLLVIDLWEHSYYKDYENRKIDYINNMINYLNWQLMESMLKKLSLKVL